MIEKLPFEITQGEYEGKKFDIKSHTSPYDMQVKINELVDAVNELQESQNTYWTDIAEIKKELQTRQENVQDSAICNTYTYIRWDEFCRLREIADKYAEITGHKGV